MPLIAATFMALACLCFAPAPAVGAAATLSARRPLRGNDTLVSAQGTFELGLFSPAGSSDGRFYLGIWYKDIPGQTVVWVGNRATPLSGVASAELRVSAVDGNLELVGPTGASASPVVVWSSNLSSSSSPGSNNTAEIRDNGNLVLVDGGNFSNVLWQSFDHPTDTYLPGAWLGENKLTGEYQALTSWRNAQDPAPGMFYDTLDPNGTAEFFMLWNHSRMFSRMYCVMLGVARGLTYLHDGCRERIIHCDIKPENILLDEDMSPRIADFGMAKLVGRDFSRALTTMRGTMGYLAPEWISGQPISAKADVYSFGMVLFELVSGRRNSERYGELEAAGTEARESFTFFPVWAAGKVVEGEVDAVADPRLQGEVMPEELERACKVACWCIQDEEAHRPTMAQVVQALEGAIHVQAPPVPRALQRLVT